MKETVMVEFWGISRVVSITPSKGVTPEIYWDIVGAMQPDIGPILSRLTAKETLEL